MDDWTMVLGILPFALLLTLLVIFLGSGHLSAWRRRREARRKFPPARR